MAVVTPRMRRDPEGRMALREHLQELRKRLVRAALAIAVGAVAGWFMYTPFIQAMIKPIRQIQLERGAAAASLNFGDPVQAFNMQVQASLLIGVFLASPVWLYQFWAFITPGLTKRERRTSIAFVASALPLFLGGAFLAWTVLPKAVEFLNAFVPVGGSNFIEAHLYFAFVTRIVLAFGIAFVLPVVLVALNLVGLLSGRALLRHWRITVFTCFLFAALATPTPEAT